MPDNSIEIDLDDEDAERVVDAWEQALGRGGSRAVQALTVLAEKHMKAEAPEGAGFNPPSLRDSVDTKPEGRSTQKVVMPFKRTSAGWLLVRAVVGNPSTPSYTDEKPPVGPLMRWARAKLGDEDAAWAIRESIFQTGHDSFPNPFVDRSERAWEDETEAIAGQAVREALG